MMNPRKRSITASEFEVEIRSLQVTISLRTALYQVLNRSGVVRLAVIGAMLWFAGSSPMTAAQARTAGSTIVVSNCLHAGTWYCSFVPIRPPR